MTRLWDTSRWHKLTAEVKKRDGYRCTYCGRPAAPDNRLTVHHADGYASPFDPDGLVTACQSCHGRISRAKQGGSSAPIPDTPSRDEMRARRAKTNRFANTLGTRRP